MYDGQSRALEEKEKREQGEDKESMGLNQTPPAAELEAAEKELAEIKFRKPSASTRCLRTSQEAAGGLGGRSQEVLESSAPFQSGSR